MLLCGRCGENFVFESFFNLSSFLCLSPVRLPRLSRVPGGAHFSGVVVKSFLRCLKCTSVWITLLIYSASLFLIFLSFCCPSLSFSCSPAPRVPRTWRGALQRGRGEIFSSLAKMVPCLGTYLFLVYLPLFLHLFQEFLPVGRPRRFTAGCLDQPVLPHQVDKA